MVVISFFVDSTLSGSQTLSTHEPLFPNADQGCIETGGGIPKRGYLCLLIHLLLCGQRSEILASQFGDEQVKAKMHANGVVVSAGVAFGLNLLHGAFVSGPMVPLYGKADLPLSHDRLPRPRNSLWSTPLHQFSERPSLHCLSISLLRHSSAFPWSLSIPCSREAYSLTSPLQDWSPLAGLSRSSARRSLAMSASVTGSTGEKAQSLSSPGTVSFALPSPHPVEIQWRLTLSHASRYLSDLVNRPTFGLCRSLFGSRDWFILLASPSLSTF